MSEHENPDIAEVNLEYEHFFERVDHWQRTLDETEPETPEFSKKAKAAMAEIDEICPYIGELVMVSGEGVIPILEVMDNVPEIVGNGTYTQDLIGNHHGVQVRTYQGSEDLVPKSHIMHLVEILKTGAWTRNGLELRNSQFAAYFPIKPTVHVTTFSDMEDILRQVPNDEQEPFDSPSVWGVLLNHSNNTREWVQSDEFRSLPDDEQQNILRRMVEEAEQAVQLRDKHLSVTSHMGYVPFLSNSDLLLMPFSLREHVIEGTILGVESLASMRLSSGKQIKTEEDIQADDAGLCLVLAPDPNIQAQFNLATDQVMYLPVIEDGQTFADA